MEFHPDMTSSYPHPILAAIAPDLDNALAVIAHIAQHQAEGRASSIRRLSGGTIETSPSQVEVIANGIAAELISQLREQVRSTVGAYTAGAALQPT